MVKTLRESHEGKIVFNKDLSSDYIQHIDRLEKRIEQIYIDKLDNIIDQEQFEIMRVRFRKEKQDYLNKLSNLERADEDYYITASYLLELASRSHELFLGSEPEEKKQIIGLTLQNLFLNDGKLEYTLVKPFDSIFETSRSLNWGGRWDLNP